MKIMYNMINEIKLGDELMRLLKLKKIVTICIVVFLLPILVIGCAKTEGITENDVAIVNGIRISLDDFNKNLALRIMDYEKQFGEDILEKTDESGQTLLEIVKQQIVDKLVLDEILLQEAKKLDISISDERIEEAFASFVEFKDKDEQLAEDLNKHGIDDDFIKRQLQRDFVIEQYTLQFIENTEITDEEARTFYDGNLEYFNTEEVRASHILVNDEILAKELRDRIEKGEDFKELAMEYSECPSAEKGGDLGFFGRGSMVAEFEDAAFLLEVDEISEPINTVFGYHIIFLEDKISETSGFDEVKQSIVTHLKRVEFQKHAEELKDNSEIILNENI